MIDKLQHLEKHSYLRGRKDLRSTHSARQETEILTRVRVYGHCTLLSDADLVWQWGAQSHQRNQNNSGVQPLCRVLIERTSPVQVGLAVRRSTELYDVRGCCK